jgi:hypothetical protein
MREPDLPILPLTQAITRLAVATTAGLAVLAAPGLASAGAYVLVLALYIAPFCYGTAALFVLPAFAVWPSLRRPSSQIAAIWGALASWCANALLFSSSISFHELVRWRVLIGFGGAGAASGLLYARLARWHPKKDADVEPGAE